MHCCGKEYTVKKKGIGKQYHLLYNVEAVGKKINWGKGEGRTEISGRK